MDTPHVYTVAGAKGGVGKTTTSINIGTALAGAGFDVVTVELDLAMANIVDFVDLDLDLDEDATLHDVLAGASDVEDAIYSLESDLDVVPSGTDLLSYAETDLQRLPDTVESLRWLYDVVILDTPAGLSEESVRPMQLADEVILVSTPRVASIRNVQNTMELAERVDTPVRGLVLSKSGTGASPGAQRIADFIETDLLGHVPEDDAVPHSQDKGVPVVESTPNSGAAHAYRRITANLVGADVKEVAAEEPAAGTARQSAKPDSDEAAEREAEDAAEADGDEAVDGQSVVAEAERGGEATDSAAERDDDGAATVAAAEESVTAAAAESKPEEETGAAAMTEVTETAEAIKEATEAAEATEEETETVDVTGSERADETETPEPAEESETAVAAESDDEHATGSGDRSDRPRARPPDPIPAPEPDSDGSHGEVRDTSDDAEMESGPEPVEPDQPENSADSDGPIRITGASVSDESAEPAAGESRDSEGEITASDGGETQSSVASRVLSLLRR